MPKFASAFSFNTYVAINRFILYRVHPPTPPPTLQRAKNMLELTPKGVEPNGKYKRNQTGAKTQGMGRAAG